METEALFWRFLDELKESLSTRTVDKIRTFLSRSLTGVKDDEIKKIKRPNDPSTVPDPINVLTLIKNVGKRIHHYPLHYASLCELTHPNAAGTINAYVTLNWSTNTAHFGKGKATLTPELALPQLVVSLQTFTKLYDQSADLLEEFTLLCESLLHDTSE
jgi:hypothetical protein